MTAPNSGVALACEAEAIPLADRPAHFALLDRLFGELSLGRVMSPGGYSYSFDPSALELIATFVKNERKCCSFLKFAIEVGPANARVWLRLSGPEGTREFLDAELPNTRT